MSEDRLFMYYPPGKPPRSGRNLSEILDQLERELSKVEQRLAAADAARATWQQRATRAEAVRDVAHSEVVTLVGENLQLRRALELARSCYQGVGGFEEAGELLLGALEQIDEALLATPRAAQLGALVEAALAVADSQIHYRDLESEELYRRLNTLVVRADAVLAREGKAKQ